jgi:2'-5' RNA ligase
MARLFVAVHLPDDVLDLVSALERPDESGVRYTTREQWHVTLRFFGEADIEEATAAFSGIEHRSVEAVLGPAVSRLGRFVVVIPVAGLEDLAATVDAATEDVGEPPDPRPFTGHVTVARLKRRGACRIAGEPIAATWTVGAVDLVQSFTEREGARYEVLATRSLG